LQKAKENTRNPKISGVSLELLGGFEPPTSSLPRVPLNLFVTQFVQVFAQKASFCKQLSAYNASGRNRCLHRSLRQIARCLEKRAAKNHW